MEFFVDTGDVGEVERAAELGIVGGVTTNPSLIAKSGKVREDVVGSMCDAIKGPVSAEVIATDREGMMREARALAAIHANIVVKLPLTEAGVAACRRCSDEGIKTNVTLCFSPLQALLAARAGATYVSPFIGRLDDIGHDGLGLIEEMRTVFDNYEFGTKILAASIRSASHVREVALMGADVATMPLDVIRGLYRHPLTDSGLARFLADHEKAGVGKSR